MSPDSIALTPETAHVLRTVRDRAEAPDYEIDAGELVLEHTRLNVLMRKGLVSNVGLGKWRLTPKGRAAVIVE